MPSFSFDIVSEIDKAEMNNVFTQAEKEISTRYDFRGTSASVEWLDDKKGLKLTGDSEWQVEAVLDIVRKKLASRDQSSKVLDLSKEKVVANLKTTWEIPFKNGLVQDLAKKIAADIRAEMPAMWTGETQLKGGASKATLINFVPALREQHMKE